MVYIVRRTNLTICAGGFRRNAVGKSGNGRLQGNYFFVTGVCVDITLVESGIVETCACAGGGADGLGVAFSVHIGVSIDVLVCICTCLIKNFLVY